MTGRRSAGELPASTKIGYAGSLATTALQPGLRQISKAIEKQHKFLRRPDAVDLVFWAPRGHFTRGYVLTWFRTRDLAVNYPKQAPGSGRER